MLDPFLQAKFLTEIYVFAHATDEMLLESRSLRTVHLLTEQINLDKEDRKSTRLNSSHMSEPRMPSSA